MGSNTKHKKKKKKKKKKHKESNISNHIEPIHTIKTVEIEEAVMKMPNLDDGSGWNSNTKILAPSDRKRKHQTFINEEPASPPNKRQKRQRYDTDSDDDSDQIADNTKSKKASDSDSDIEVTRKSNIRPTIKQESDSESDSDIEPMRKPKIEKIKEDKNETVYRDNKGKRISESEYNQLKRQKLRKYDDENEDEMEWASGLVQKYKAFESKINAQRQKFHSIARYKDDAAMNMELQNEYRADDPMNKMDGYKDKSQSNEQAMNDEDIFCNRPYYKGKPWPNRYGILPGYRWDGIDRSNGFETKKLLKMSHTKDRKKKAYKFANTDM